MFLVSVFFIPNNKFLFLVTATYILSLFIVNKSIYETVFYAFLPLSLVLVGQGYFYIAIPGEAIKSEGYEEGKILNYFFSPFIVLLILISFLFFVNLTQKLFRKKSFIKFKPFIISFLFFFLFSFFSAISNDSFPKLSFLYFLNDFLFFISCFFIALFISDSKEKTNKMNLILLNLVILSVFLGMVVIFQFINKSPLGIIAEMSHEVPFFGGGADEDSSLFRPIGIFTHANILANYLSNLFFSIFLLKAYLIEKKELLINKKFINIGLLLIFISIFSTLSRAVYLALFLSALIYMFIFRKEISASGKKIVKKILKVKYLIFLLPLMWNVAVRIIYSFNSFYQEGGVGVREKLTIESLALLRRNFFYGVGTGMFIPSLFRENPIGIISEFPESVHNGILLNLIENGFLSFFFFLMVYFLFFKALIALKANKKIIVISFLAIFSQLVISFFHPFTNTVTLYTFIMILIIYDLYAIEKK